MFGTISSKLT